MKKRSLSLLLALALVLTSAITPAFAATTANLKQQRETEHFVFYCMDQDVKALDDLAEALEGCYERTTTDLGKTPSGKVKVNIYPDIDSFHNAMGRPNAPDWSVGEAKNGALYMTSPLNPGPSHDYDGMLQIAVHEFVHIIINLFGNVPSYLHEGVACYEAGQNRYDTLSSYIAGQMDQNKVPSLSSLEKYNSSSEGMYQYGPAFVDFIARCYGFDAVVALLEGKSLSTAIGKDGASMQNQSFNEFWWQFLDNLYRKKFGLSSGECLETDHFVFLFMKQDSEAVSKLAEKLEQDRVKITADLGAAPAVKTMIYLYPDIESFHKAIVPSAGDQIATWVGYHYNNIFSVIPENPGSQLSEGQVRADIRIMSNIAALLPLASGNAVPSYVYYGVSAYEAGIEFNDLKGFVKKAADSGTLPTLAEVEKMNNNTGGIQYGYLYVEFVAQTLGNKNLNDNLASLVKGKSPETVFGMTSQEMESAWQAFLKDYDKQVSAPNLETADTWAQSEITSAVRKGFVPTDLQNNYKSTITREQFCRMAVMYLEYATGKGIDTILSERNLTIDEDAFEDTDNKYILAAYALEITKGTRAPSEGKPGVFDPNGSFNREMAATMLARVSKILGEDTENAAGAGYTDISSASSWAVNSINFCYASKVMTGTSTTPLKFSPKEAYTIQQSIATFDRMG